MKRSEINRLANAARVCWEAHGWTLPPNPRWDITDFGLNDCRRYGLVLMNLAEEPEYCEKLMYVQKGMTTPAHTHASKKEDIICRWGEFRIQLWPGKPEESAGKAFQVQVNNEMREGKAGDVLHLRSGERITLCQGMYHEFAGVTDECIIGEVSTANDDAHDNFFANPAVDRCSPIEEDEPATVRLLWE
jgi:D-lyxose ketol-isomerase